MATIDDYTGSRDNNLNLIRMIAATGVLVSHAWPIALGAGTGEPLGAQVGFTMGTLSVFAFFIISGFLIATSYDRSSTLRRFLAARTLRLFPGLVLSLFVVAFAMGPLVTQLPVADYLADREVYTFILRNTALLLPQYTLPGVFTSNPYPTVEGSIWTLIHEVACYVGLFILGVAGLLQRRTVMTALLLAYVVIWAAIPMLDIEMHSKIEAFRRLSLPFAWGMALYLWRDRIPLKLWIAVVLLLGAWLTRGTFLYPLGVIVAMGYGLFWLAYVPGGLIRHYNRIGDYSYGMYIYAFPVQGLVVWLFGPMTPLQNILYALPITLGCAILSWHLVEKPALGLLKKGPRRDTAREVPARY